MNVDKLAKVLALAASDNDSEALHALRTARRLLESEGVDFVELAGRLSGETAGGVSVDRLQDTIFDLRNEVRHLRSENERLRREQASAAAPAGFAANLSQAANAVASAIRLRSTLAETQAELEGERAKVLQMEAAAAHHARQLADLRDQAEHHKARLGELEERRHRLEAENRRLGSLAETLKHELDERTAARNRLAAELAASGPRPVPEQPKRRQGGGRRGKNASQYALL